MPGKGLLFRTALAIERSARHSRLGPLGARIAYWMWDRSTGLLLGVRMAVLGDTAVFHLLGKPVRLDLHDRAVTRVLYLFHEFEQEATLAFARLLRPGITVVDIGANIGYYTIISAQAVGVTGRVLAFEPGPDNIRILRHNVALNGLDNVTVRQEAVAANGGRLTLHLSSINPGDHRIYNGEDDDLYNVGRTRQTVEVESVALDDFLETLDWNVDLIKMDVQGAEHAALQGMKRTLTRNKDVVLMAEYWPHGLSRSGTTPDAFLKELGELGFQAFLPSDGGSFLRITPTEIASIASGDMHLTLFFSRRDIEESP